MHHAHPTGTVTLLRNVFCQAEGRFFICLILFDKVAQFEYHINILTTGTGAHNNRKEKRKQKHEYADAWTEAMTINTLTLKPGSCKLLAYKALLSLKKSLLIHTLRIALC